MADRGLLGRACWRALAGARWRALGSPDRLTDVSVRQAVAAGGQGGALVSVL